MSQLNGHAQNRLNGSPSLLWDHSARDLGTPTHPKEGYDRFSIPHVLSFASNIGSYRGYYKDLWDEALRVGRQDALVMENDVGLMGPLNERMLAAASLPGHVHVPDEKDPRQKQVQSHITKTLEGMVGPEQSLLKLKMNLLWATWFGRQGAKPIWDWRRQDGIKTLYLADWSPVRGDKIAHLKDGTPTTDVYPGVGRFPNDAFPGADLTPSTNGAYQFALHGNMSWGDRQRMIIHAHELIDRDFFDAEGAEAAFGSGIRSRVFWLDWVSREWLAATSTFVERVGLGITIWYYRANNDQAKKAAELAARQQGNRSNILVPLFGDEKMPAVERVEVPTNGAELLLRLRQDIREQQMRYIIGQTMSTGGSKDTGGDMGGSNRSKFAADTKDQIRNYDARNLDATLTGSMMNPGIVSMIQYHTFPWSWPSEQNPDGFQASWVSELEEGQDSQKVESGIKLVSQGVEIKADELRSAAGYGKPQDGDEIVSMQQPGVDPEMPGAPQEAAPEQPGGGQGGDWMQEQGPRGGQWERNVKTGARRNAAGSLAKQNEPQSSPVPSSRRGSPERYAFDEQNHPRGQSENKGEFGPGGGQGGQAGAKPPEPKPMVSIKGQKPPQALRPVNPSLGLAFPRSAEEATGAHKEHAAEALKGLGVSDAVAAGLVAGARTHADLHDAVDRRLARLKAAEATEPIGSQPTPEPVKPKQPEKQKTRQAAAAQSSGGNDRDSILDAAHTALTATREGMHGTADLRHVYAFAKHADPSLTPERFRSTLEALNKEHKGDLLHVFNEVHQLSPEERALMPVSSTGKTLGFVMQPKGAHGVAHLKTPQQYAFDPDQPRHPRGKPEGGRWQSAVQKAATKRDNVLKRLVKAAAEQDEADPDSDELKRLREVVAGLFREYGEVRDEDEQDDPEPYSRDGWVMEDTGCKLAQAYAELFNEEEDEIPEDQLEAAGAVLGRTDWVLHFDGEKWVVHHAEEGTFKEGDVFPTQVGVNRAASTSVGGSTGLPHASGGESEDYARHSLRAPRGGVHIGGKFYRGGQFIPSEFTVTASSAGVSALSDAPQKPAKTAPMPSAARKTTAPAKAAPTPPAQAETPSQATEPDAWGEEAMSKAGLTEAQKRDLRGYITGGTLKSTAGERSKQAVADAAKKGMAKIEKSPEAVAALQGTAKPEAPSEESGSGRAERQAADSDIVQQLKGTPEQQREGRREAKRRQAKLSAEDQADMSVQDQLDKLGKQFMKEAMRGTLTPERRQHYERETARISGKSPGGSGGAEGGASGADAAPGGTGEGAGSQPAAPAAQPAVSTPPSQAGHAVPGLTNPVQAGPDVRPEFVEKVKTALSGLPEGVKALLNRRGVKVGASAGKGEKLAGTSKMFGADININDPKGTDDFRPVNDVVLHEVGHQVHKAVPEELRREFTVAARSDMERLKSDPKLSHMYANELKGEGEVFATTFSNLNNPSQAVREAFSKDLPAASAAMKRVMGHMGLLEGDQLPAAQPEHHSRVESYAREIDQAMIDAAFRYFAA